MIKKKAASFIFTCIAFVFMLFLSCNEVNAEYYDSSKNGVVEDTIYVSRSDNVVKFTLNYQNGVKDLKVYICEDSTNCGDGKHVTKFVHAASLDPGDPNGANGLINSQNSATSFQYVSTATPDAGLPLMSYSDKIDQNGKRSNNYYLKITATFCITRTEDNTRCQAWDDSPSYALGVNVDLDNGGITSDSKINSTLAKILNVVNNIVIPILWGILAVLLIVRGIMLGIDIVKSADEPEVRKKKVSGLIWLFIGVGVGYAVTIIANVVIGMFGFGGIFS